MNPFLAQMNWLIEINGVGDHHLVIHHAAVFNRGEAFCYPGCSTQGNATLVEPGKADVCGARDQSVTFPPAP